MSSLLRQLLGVGADTDPADVTVFTVKYEEDTDDEGESLLTIPVIGALLVAAAVTTPAPDPVSLTLATVVKGLLTTAAAVFFAFELAGILTLIVLD